MTLGLKYNKNHIDELTFHINVFSISLFCHQKQNVVFYYVHQNCGLQKFYNFVVDVVL